MMARTSSTSTLPQPVAPFTALCCRPEIAWPHQEWRPLLPRGLPITTTKPAAACIWASSKNVSPYCVNGPPWTLSRTGYLRRDSNPAGRMIQASISSLPSVVGTVNFSQPEPRARDLA